MSRYTRYPPSYDPRPQPRAKFPTERELRDAVDRFVREHPDVKAVYIAAVRGGELTVELHVEIADGVVAWKWDTGRSRWRAGVAQAGRLEELLTERGVAVYRRRPW